MPARQPRRRRSPSAASSGSWSSRRRSRSCPRSGERRERGAQGRHRRRRAGRPLRAPTSWPGWATSRSSSRPSPGPAACSCRPSRPTGCRARSSSREVRMIEDMGVALRVRQGARQGLHARRASRTRATRRCSSASAPRRASAWASPARTARACPTASPSSRVQPARHGRGGQERRRHRRRQLRHRRRPHRPAARRRAASRSSTAARARRCRPGTRRSTPPTTRASTVLTLVAPEEILRDASGKVTGVRCKEMALGDFDRSGRRRPVAGRNPDFVVEADPVIAAIGQSLDAPAVLDGTPVELNRWGYLAVDPRPARPRSTGSSPAATPSPARPRWSRPIGAGETAPRASTSS